MSNFYRIPFVKASRRSLTIGDTNITLLSPFVFLVSGGNVYNESLSLARSLIADTYPSFVSFATLSLSRSHEATTTSDLLGSVAVALSRSNQVGTFSNSSLFGSLILGRSNQAVASGSLSILSGLTLNRLEGASSSSNLSLAASLNLSKSLEAQLQTIVQMTVQLTLGTTKAVTTISGMTLMDAILLGAAYATAFDAFELVYGETPQIRIIAVSGEDRTFQILVENRRLTIEAEDRLFEISFENRTIIVSGENRIIPVLQGILDSKERYAMTEMLKHPEAVKDYKFDWKAKTNGSGSSDWLQAGETITSHQMIMPDGLTLVSSSITDAGTSVTAWISGGMDGRNYEVSCKIQTSAGRVEVATVIFKVGNNYI